MRCERRPSHDARTNNKNQVVHSTRRHGRRRSAWLVASPNMRPLQFVAPLPPPSPRTGYCAPDAALLTASTPATKKAVSNPLPAHQHPYNKINALCAPRQDSIVRPWWQSAQRHSAAHSLPITAAWCVTRTHVAQHRPSSRRSSTWCPKGLGRLHGKKELHNQQLQGLYKHSRHTPHQGRQAAVKKSCDSHTQHSQC